MKSSFAIVDDLIAIHVSRTYSNAKDLQCKLLKKTKDFHFDGIDDDDVQKTIKIPAREMKFE